MPKQKTVQKDDHEVTAVDLTSAMSHNSMKTIYRQVRQTRLHKRNYTCRNQLRREGGVEESSTTDCSLRIETTENKKPKSRAVGDVMAKPRRKRKRTQGSKRSDCPKELKRKVASEWQ